jgi:hypothetical protein
MTSMAQCSSYHPLLLPSSPGPSRKAHIPLMGRHAKVRSSELPQAILQNYTLISTLIGALLGDVMQGRAAGGLQAQLVHKVGL